MTTLQNKTALVTGASRGIGRATAAALAEAGAHVLVHYGRSAKEAESLVAKIQAKGGRANVISADLGIPDGALLLAKQVRFIVGDRLDVYYFPRNSADVSLLVRTEHSTDCPYKGDCAYYSIPIGGVNAENAAWTHEKPYEAAADIKEYLAFYSTRVDAIEVIS
jgi:uncharacterized protein (DUF427 family)